VRRDADVAGYGRWFWQRRTAPLVPVVTPRPGARPDYLINQEKFVHLSRSKLLLNSLRWGSTSSVWLCSALPAGPLGNRTIHNRPGT